MFNLFHSNRHSKAKDVSENDPAVATLINPKTNRKANIVEKGGVFVVVLDAEGELVTKFKRDKPTHGGLEGTIEYLRRVGYE
jgi:hypothetical protein